MKKLIFITLLLLFAIGLAAHPASKITLSYDAKTMLLTVDYDHTVKNPADHFIATVIIKVDDKDVISHSPGAQESSTGGSLVYKLLGVKSGTVIEAVSTCNKNGKKTAKLTVK
ncbi:MAG: hypothetical protein CVU50_06495 [Candidatus Cloacimonetes bacterium HGW-Cloacimonetes-3]|jgi:hypothetical protein|nr:MAG: hypothetical protein CVU50_06495 [Candidatus Cloacimonetes bacterium HGW-Cloacimonetes-3]